MLCVLREHHSSFHFWMATLMAFLCAYIPDPRFPDYGKVELVFSEGPERIPGRFLTLELFQTLLQGVGRKSRHRAFSIFPFCAVLCSVPPPLPPGEKGYGMLQRGNVVWSVCWQRGKGAQHVLTQSSTGVSCVGLWMCVNALCFVYICLSVY